MSLKYIFDQKELNLGQKRWLGLIKDYDYTIEYHSGKTNVVVDTLSRKFEHSKASLNVVTSTLLRELSNSHPVVLVEKTRSLLTHFQIRPTLIDDIIKGQ